MEGWLRMSIIDSEQNVYFRLVRSLPLLPIESDEELDRAIAMINSLLDKPSLSPGEHGYLDVLSDLVEKYESTEHPIEPVSDGAMLRHLIEAKGITQTEFALASEIAAAAISDVLSGERQLARTEIARLASYFCVDPAVFDSPRKGRSRTAKKRK
jgi:HTH-type transcriptional regulator / antitoxin HigA